MLKLRPNTLLVTLFALLVFSKGTTAQNREKIKANLIFKMLDFDARFRMIPGYRDSTCRMILANQAKAEYLDFKQTYLANTSLFHGNERGKLNEIVKACDKIFLRDEVFNSLKQPDYISEKKPSKGEVMDKKWIDIHKTCLYVLIKDLVVRSNFEISYEFSRLAAAADVARNGELACRHYADSLLTKGGPLLDKHFQTAELKNSPESNGYFQDLIAAFKNKAADLPEQTLAMYERRNVLMLSPASEDADIHLTTMYSYTSVHLDGLIRELNETDKYAIDNPSGLYIDYLFFRTKAHQAKKDEKADLTIRIVTPGIIHMNYNEPVYTTDYRHPGYVSTITYHFPVKVEILNKTGNIERTFIAADEHNLFTDTLHANMLNNLRPGRGVIPFLSEEACRGSMADPDLKNNVINILAGSRWNQLAPGISAALNNGYGSWKVSTDFYEINGLKNHKEHLDIANIVDSTIYAIGHLGKEAEMTANKATLSRMLEKYQEILKNPDISHNVRILCMRNSIQAAILSDQLARTMTLIDDYRKVKTDDLLVPSTKFPIFSFRYWLMQHTAATVKLPPYSTSYDM